MFRSGAEMSCIVSSNPPRLSDGRAERPGCSKGCDLKTEFYAPSSLRSTLVSIEVLQLLVEAPATTGIHPSSLNSHLQVKCAGMHTYEERPRLANQHYRAQRKESRYRGDLANGVALAHSAACNGSCLCRLLSSARADCFP